MTHPQRFGRFDVKGVLGKGGMGTVYHAIDPVIGREVAIKEIKPEPATSASDEAELKARFELEFRSAGQLSHPNIVTIYDVGQGGGSYFIAMEYVEGQSLAQLLYTRGKLPVAEVLELAGQIADALDYAHAQGIVHRDIKPGNILLDSKGRAQITDFGLAKVLSVELTRTGMLLGTPGFMSPEQITGQAIDGRSDQFSFAIILYQMLTGCEPFRAEHPSAVLYKVVHDQPSPPSQVNQLLPDGVDKVLLRALAKSATARYSSCHDLVAALAAALAGSGQGATAAASATATTATGPPSAPPHPSRPHETHALSSPDAFVRTPDNASSVATRRAHLARHTRRRLRLAGAASALLAVAAIAYLVSSRNPSQTPEASAEAEIVVEPETLFHDLRIETREAELAIWRNGVDTGKVTPDALRIEGPAGSRFLLELRRGDEIVAQQEFALGEPLPDAWQPEPASEPQTLTVTSEPAGATVHIDGRALDQTTPAAIELAAGRSYELRLELASYKPVAMTFTLEDLSAEQLASGLLHFPLRAAIPPGTLTIEAPYAVAVRVGKRRYRAASRQQISLPPGTHQVELRGDSVFWRQTQTVVIASHETVKLQAPQTVAIDIAANPSNCQVEIDGLAAGFTPLNDLRIVAGAHDFVFHWPGLDQRRATREVISRDQQRIFMTPQ